MRTLIGALIVLLLASFSYAAVSNDEIVKLSKLKTGDEVIIQLIQREGLTRPITSKDVVYLKEQGVSDRVVQYMLKVSKADMHSLPPQESKSTQLEGNMRSYYTTGKDGKKVLVVTNLDENGKRMGGEVPPPPVEAVPQETKQKAPQEVRVIVENAEQPSGYDYRNEYPEEPDYVDDRYNPPSYYAPGYPAYPYYGAGSYYSPYLYDYPYRHNKSYRPVDPNQPQWRYDQHLNRPQPTQRPAPRTGPTQTPAHGGVRPPSRPTRH